MSVIEPVKYGGAILYHGHEVIKPIGLSNHEWNRRMDEFFRVEVPKRLKEIKERISKSQQTKRLMERVFAMDSPTFITVTLNDEYVTKPNNIIIRAFRESLQRAFGKDIKWVLVSDYGKEKGRLHFHGFVDVPEQELINLWNLKYKGHKKYYSVYANYDYFIGGISINKGYGDFYENAIYYCTKYIEKDGELLRHHVYGSRIGAKSMDEIAHEFFGV